MTARPPSTLQSVLTDHGNLARAVHSVQLSVGFLAPAIQDQFHLRCRIYSVSLTSRTKSATNTPSSDDFCLL